MPDLCPALAVYASQTDLAQAVSFPHELPDTFVSPPDHPTTR